MTTGTVEVEPGVRIFFQDLGAGRPVVLLAGFGMSHEVWDDQVRVLSARNRVVCVDVRGTGGSDKPLHGYEVPRLAEDVRAVLEHLDLREVTLLGWSFGGQIAFQLAARHPDRLAQLVLVGSNAVRASRSVEYPFGRVADEVEPALVAAEGRDRLAARRATIASGFAAEPRPDVLDWLLRISLLMPSWAAVASYNAYLRADLVAELERVTLPVLQVVGAADPVHSAKGAAWLNERLTDARLIELDGCGHYPMLEAPADFNTALLEFIGQHLR